MPWIFEKISVTITNYKILFLGKRKNIGDIYSMVLSTRFYIGSVLWVAFYKGSVFWVAFYIGGVLLV